MKDRNKEVTIITYFFFFIFIALVGYFIYFQAVKSETFINSPYNTLQDLFSEHVVRGKIISADGYTLAETEVKENGDEVRKYPYGRKFAHAVGYSTNGKTGLESQANFALLRSHEFFADQIINDFKDEKNIGDNVITTLDYEIQNRAYEALGDQRGAVIIMEPATGKIIAMVSKPDYDPNSVVKNWEKLNSSEDSVLYNRATQGLYAPGSVFKIVTLLEYYRENTKSYKDYSYKCTGSISHDGKTLKCAGGEVHGSLNLKESFAESCNSSFANIGLQINNDKLKKTCNSLLFNKDLPIEFESSKSRFSLSSKDSDALTMETSIGQGKTMVSPLHMVMLASSINNKGTLMKPYLIDHIENNAGDTISTTKPEEYGQLMSEKEAALIESYMAEVVKSGTGTKLKGQSYKAYGKTGTAQVSDSDANKTNAWFVGYASKKGYNDIAIAVIVEHSGTGSKYAIPVAKRVFDLYFNR
ncbi:MAG: penicillin-binding transpeptidase domain-containing protein [Agathobacter sp.]|nr:penicillin-binding transpeptidase domain-containing protein [Agathobacter sp.]